MRWSRAGLGAMFGGILALTGCSGAKLWSLLSISPAETIERDVVFDAPRDLKVDIYYAPETPGKTAETVVFVYGGSWYDGDKSQYGFVADGLVKAGFNVVIPNYRLFPDVAYPEFVDDLAVFMDWYHQSAQGMGLSLQNVHIMAHSAGAFNAALYLTSPEYQKPFAFKSFVGLAGPYDYFLPTDDPKYIPVFTRNGDYNNEQSLPAHQAPKNLAGVVGRALLMHGAKDTIVTPKNLQNFADYLEEQGVPVSTIRYPDTGHVGIIQAVNNVPFNSGKPLKDVITFLNQP